MRIVSYTADEGPSYGIVLPDERVVDIPGAFRATGDDVPPTLRGFLAAAGSVRKSLELLRVIGERKDVGSFPRSELMLLPPVPNPSKVVAIGLNYRDHCREQGVESPKTPLLFAKFPSALIGADAEVVWNPDLATKVDLEAELGVVIGARAHRVPEAEALGCVLGYTIINDVTARDLQFGDGQWVRGKSLDTFCPAGPWIVTTDEIPDPHTLAISSSVDGTAWQDSSTSEMIFRIPFLISFISQGITLEPGDLIATGTPAGVGVFHKPPRYLQDGETISVRIERIGELRSRCRMFGA
jgi:2-keto-4-pentenoate hydratase/2-oxohepta-3-ene-1,7-dioic acid hydratase in catechol pathway